MTLAAIQALVDGMVRADATTVSTGDRDAAIFVAVIRYSKDRPRTMVADVTASGGVFLSLPTGWEVTTALDGGESGLRKLNEQLRFADAAEMEHIHDLTMHGQATEATTGAISLLRRQIGGLAEQEMGAFAKSWRDVKNAMSEFADWTSRAWRDPTLTEKIIAERKKLAEAEAELKTPGMKTTGGLNRLHGDPMAETRERAARARQALTLLERTARDEPANQAAANENMMTETASSRFSATEYARAKREREDRARILAISNPVARRQADAEFAARKDGAARGIEGGYLDLYAKQAGRGAVDETGTSARDATAAARLQAEGQEHLAKAASQSSEALRRAAVDNKIAAFYSIWFDDGTGSIREFVGVGGLGAISAIEEGSELRSYGMSATLTGVDAAQLAMALNSKYQGRTATIWLGLLDEGHVLIDAPVEVFRGIMDTMPIELGATGTVTVNIENVLSRWESPNPRNQRYTDADQRDVYPNDRAFEFASSAVAKELIWGRA